MPSATIVPKYVNPPKPGKKYGSIKDETGFYWGCSPSLLNQFTVGRPTTIEYKTTPREDGTEYRSVTSVQGGEALSTPGGRDGSNTPKDENIFVCGVVNHAIAHQSFPLEAHELARLVKMARQAWQEGSKPIAPATAVRKVPTEEDDFGDNVPF